VPGARRRARREPGRPEPDRPTLTAPIAFDDLAESRANRSVGPLQAGVSAEPPRPATRRWRSVAPAPGRAPESR
jgi:hypothetical protein